MNRSAIVYCLLFAGIASAQTAITSVTNESGSNSLCPGGVAFIKGSSLGTTAATVTVAAKKAFVLNAFGGGTSLQVELPVGAPLGPATVTVGASAPFNITLVQFCPGIPINSSNGVSFLIALHDNNGLPVTAAFPAIPDELVDILATGLGPTTPVYATGTTPPDSNANTNTKPTVSIGGQPANVANSFLYSRNGPGFYLVVSRTPTTIASGNLNVTISIGGLTSNTGILPLTNGGAVSSVTNAASYNDPSLPNGAIAQGAIAVAKGKNLGPASIVADSTPFQNATLSGTSVAITVGGTTVAGLMYYTSFNQIAFLVPSNTPVGTGTVTVTYNGQAGAPAPITIVANSLGVFTISSSGQGPGIVTYADYSLVSATNAANCGGPYTTCGAANPNDTLILWATGLGPVNGSDAAGAGLGQNMPGIPLSLWIGGVQANVTYQGRSGCCVGEDQIVFTVPANAPTGCAVPLVVQIDTVVSNTTSIPIANGSRTCNSASSALTQDEVSFLATASSFSVASLELDHFLNKSGSGFFDQAQLTFVKATGIPAATQPFVPVYLDHQPLGTCTAFTGDVSPSDAFFNSLNLTPLDAGSKFTVQGPKGAMTFTLQPFTPVSLSATGAYLVPGNYTISGTGGNDIGPFTANITLPASPILTSPSPGNFTVTRSKGFTVTWNPNGSDGHAEIILANGSGSGAVTVVCTAPASLGTFTIPAYVLYALPAATSAFFAFQPGDQGPASSATFTVTGVNAGVIQTFVDGVENGSVTIN